MAIRRVTLLPLIVLACCRLAEGAGPPAPAATTPTTRSDRARIAELIEQLDARESAVRKRARLELIRIGVPALDALKAATESDEPERAYQAELAIEQITRLTLDLSDTVSMKLTYIPAGTFRMGSPADEPGRDATEGPQRDVTLTRPFFMGIYPVTQEQYQAIMGDNPSNAKGPTLPVEMVSYDMVAEFCQKMSRKTGRAVRLPTEAEWEYACRAGSKTRFSFGDDPANLCDHAWGRSHSSNQTHPVGQKKPNVLGLYDMQGNVQQWCSDFWDGTDYAKAAKTDPTGPATAPGDARVIRGSWCGEPVEAYRSARRSSMTPGSRVVVLGLRVVTPCTQPN